MKTIDVKDQPKLSLNRTFEICLNGIKYRFFRSTVTMLVIAVAIAFMMNTLCEGISKKAVQTASREAIRQQLAATRWMNRLTSPITPENLLMELANTKDDDPLIGEVQAMGGLDKQQADNYRQFSKDAVIYLNFFDDLNYGYRRVLVSDASGVGIFSRLSPGSENKKRFDEKIKTIKAARLPQDELFELVLKKWNLDQPNYNEITEKIIAGYNNGIENIKIASQGKPIDESLSESSANFGETIRKIGFTSFTSEVGNMVTAQALNQKDTRRIDEAMSLIGVRQRIAARIYKQPGEVKTANVWNGLRGSGDAEFLLNAMQTEKMDVTGLTTQRIVDLAKYRREIEINGKAAQACMDAGGGLMGLGVRMTWLIIVSLLVCAVGISNAMLMSVTERFREIATLKCLGALDGFIMALFVMEAGLLGLIGGAIGAVIGSIIGFGRMAVSFGTVFTGAFPWLAWGEGFFFSLIVGIVLAALAGVYPSYIAARLAPMEAMRIE
jgi:hypothetical protein